MTDKNPTLIALGLKIRKLRLSQGLSQEALAVASELDRTYIGGVERGERNISVLNLKKISDSLGCTLVDLVNGLHKVKTEDI